MGGRYHMSVALPDGRVARADFREPIVGSFHAISRARAMGKQPPPADVAAVLAWLDANEAQVAACGRGECDHEP